MVNALPTSQTGDDVCLFSFAFRRDDKGDVLPDGFFRGVSEYSFRTVIPTRYDAVKVLADNGIIGRGHNGSQQTRYFFCLLLLAHICVNNLTTLGCRQY